jgi:hypothetical protein
VGGLGGTARGGAVDVEAGSFSAFVCSFQRNRSTGGPGGNGGPGGTSIRYDYGIAGSRGGDGGMAVGGAIAAQNSSGHVASSTFADNSAAGGSGGAGGPSGPVPPAWGGDGAMGAEARGGAIFFAGAVLRCTNSTLFHNTVISGSGGPGGAGHPSYLTQTGNGGAAGNSFGGALWSGSGDCFGLNLTFFDNASLAGSAGVAGIAGTTNSTPGTNGATGFAAGGAVGVSTNGIASLQNTILANSLEGGNCSGAIIDAGHNLSSDSTCALPSGTSLGNTDPLLGPWQDNGGPTYTMALQPGSPAIDAGDPLACPSTDQRGLARPGGPACDIGAYEAVGVFAIAGRVSVGTNGADGITVTVGALRTRTDALGNYRVAGFPPGEYVVTPLPANGAFTPLQRVVTIGPDANAIDFSLNRANISAFNYTIHGMRVRFTAPDEQRSVAEVSSNLVDWVRLPVAMEASSGHLQFLDTNAPLHNIRFYRIANQ